jgi:hypothetical protein
VTLTNPSVKLLPYKLVSHVGDIVAATAVPLDEQSYGELSYLPSSVEPGAIGRSSPTMIAGNDVIMLQVRTREAAVPDVSVAPTAPPPPRVRHRGLSLPRRLNSLRDALRDRPSFFQSFDTVVVDWEFVERTSTEALGREGEWLVQTQKLRIVVDLSNGMRILPGLRLVNNSAVEYAESLRRIGNVVRKLPALGARDLLLSLHMVPEATPNMTQASDDFAASLRHIAALALPHNISVHLRHNLKLPLGPGAKTSLAHFNQPPCGDMTIDRGSLASTYDWLDHYALRPAVQVVSSSSGLIVIILISLSFISSHYQLIIISCHLIMRPAVQVAVGASLLVFHGSLARDILPQLGNASMLMVASPMVDAGGMWSEHGRLAAANLDEMEIIAGLVAATKPEALLVLDAAFADTDAEYEDARLLNQMTRPLLGAP